MSDTLAKIWTPYVRRDCGFTPPHPVFLIIEEDKPGVYCRLVTFNPYYIIANLHVQSTFGESAKKYVNAPIIKGKWQLYTASQKARYCDVKWLSSYSSFINSFLNS